MNKATRFRNNIPFFYDKSDLEMKQDPYENYEVSVKKQVLLHLADEAWNTYPFLSILNYIHEQLDETEHKNIVELGCGVGRMIGEIAEKLPSSTCWGIDYSYQMLKQAYDSFVQGKILDIDFRDFGFKPKVKAVKHSLNNLGFGLAKAEVLPFENNSVDFVFSSFGIDRFEAPEDALLEMYRILKKQGKAVIVSPLNFVKKEHWEMFYPVEKLISVVEQIGFRIDDFQNDFIVEEPFDARGNKKKWKCVALVLAKC